MDRLNSKARYQQYRRLRAGMQFHLTKALCRCDDLRTFAPEVAQQALASLAGKACTLCNEPWPARLGANRTALQARPCTLRNKPWPAWLGQAALH